MGLMDLTSQITFLYFDDLEEAKVFFQETLELEIVFDPKWACVWRIGKDAFIGGVDVKEGSIEVESRGGVLISFTVNNIDHVYGSLKEKGLKDMTEIRYFEDIHLKSFIITGPQGYKFEVQEFTDQDLNNLF